MVPVAQSFLLISVETHGKAIEIDVQNKTGTLKVE
jgi:hypothetical protein